MLDGEATPFSDLLDRELTTIRKILIAKRQAGA